jgi:hypothetical protein
MWKKYDHDCTMFLHITQAFKFIEEVLETTKRESGMLASNGGKEEGIFVRNKYTNSLADIPMQYSLIMRRLRMDDEMQVPFLQVVDVILLVVCFKNNQEYLKEMEESEEKLNMTDPKAFMRLRRFEEQQIERTGVNQRHTFLFAEQVAASKLQRAFRARKLRKRSRTRSSELRGQLAAGAVEQGPSGSKDISSEESLAAVRSPQIDIEHTEMSTDEDEVEDRVREHLVPRSGAAIDGLDEPGNCRTLCGPRPKLRTDSEDEHLQDRKNGKACGEMETHPKLSLRSAGSSDESPQEILVPPVAG